MLVNFSIIQHSPFLNALELRINLDVPADRIM